MKTSFFTLFLVCLITILLFFVNANGSVHVESSVLRYCENLFSSIQRCHVLLDFKGDCFHFTVIVLDINNKYIRYNNLQFYFLIIFSQLRNIRIKSYDKKSLYISLLYLVVKIFYKYLTIVLESHYFTIASKNKTQFLDCKYI